MTDPEQQPRAGELFFYTGIAGFVSFVLVMAIGLAIYGIAFGGPSAAEQADRDAAAAAQEEAGEIEIGERVYAQRCASCHGTGGEGGVGPSFDGVTERYPEVADHETIVREGAGRMPAFGDVLNDRQIEAVVAYERQLVDGG